MSKLIPKHQNGNPIIPKYYGAYDYKKDKWVLPAFNDSGETHITLPNIEITPRNTNLTEVVDRGRDNVGRAVYNASTYVSSTGDAQDAFQVKKDLQSGNYGQAALGVGLLLLPNIIEKPIKGAIKAGKKLFKPTSKAISQLSIKDVQNLTDQKWDDLYNRAIQSGNKEEVQKIRDLHFQSKAPNTVFKDSYYHGSGKSFNVFDPTKIGNTDQGWLGRGYYFTPSKDYAEMYGKTKRFYLNATAPMEGKGIAWFNREDVNPILLRNPNIKAAVERGKLADSSRGSMPQTKPYDGYFEEDVMKNNTQMKLANSITYDDAGNMIPISKRDNFSNPDIRYGLIPLIGLGLYNKKENE